MAKEQTNVLDLQLLESTDLQELEQVRRVVQENLSTDKGSVLLNSLVDYYLDSNSPQALDLLSSVREPHDKHLLEKMTECLAKPACRLATLTLLGHVVRKQQPWIHKIARSTILTSLLKCLKSESDVVVLITGVLVLVILLPMIPQSSKQLLFEFFDIFGRLAAWNQKNHGNTQGVFAVHLHASVYSLFHRLYGMYPCNFVSYLRAHYSMKENVDTFEEVVKPMLEHVRIHPELVTGTKEYELDPIRWKRFETHDIIIECAKVSLDPKEASCEEGYSSLPDQVPRRFIESSRSCSDLSSHGNSSFNSMSTVRQSLSLSLSLPQLTVTQHLDRSPQPPILQVPPSGMKEVWSPSSMCGMSTPPSSRGMSPPTVSELSHSASHLSRVPCTPVDGKWTSSASTPSGSSPLPAFPGESENTAQNTSNLQAAPKINQDLVKEHGKGVANDGPFTLNEVSDFVKRTEREKEEESITEELLTITHSSDDPTPAPDLSFSNFIEPSLPLNSNQHTLSHELVSTPQRAAHNTPGDQQPACSLWPCFTPIDDSLSPSAADDASVVLPRRSCPYEPLFDLALPKLASLFVERKTSEVQKRVGGESEYREELEGEDLSATSPLELLDRIVQQGHDLQEKMLRSPSLFYQASELHSGGSGAPDELALLRSQLVLLHNHLLYERHKREQHALRNRRLLRRVINATALEEQNNSMKVQLRLQEVELQTLRLSLQEEQKRSKHQQQDRGAQVQLLQCQLQQLQSEKNEYYTKNQEQESDLKENCKRMGEMEAELQGAKNKVCHTGHLLDQQSIKLNNFESMEQQMAFLNKQLLLVGEANKLCVQEVHRLGPDLHKEQNMLQVCSSREAERTKQNSIQQSQKLEAALQRLTDLEAQLSKKEHLILEQKKLLENVKNQAKDRLQASENRYLAQKHVTQALQSEILQLYSQLELSKLTAETPQNQRSNGSRTSRSAQTSESDQREEVPHMCINGEYFSPGSPSSTALINGSQEDDLSVLSCNSPLDKDSYANARSFLELHNQELVKKRKSQYEEEQAPVSPLPHPLQDPSSDPAVKYLAGDSGTESGAQSQSEFRPVDQPRARAYNVQSRRQQDLRIMDYNETHQSKA